MCECDNCLTEADVRRIVNEMAADPRETAEEIRRQAARQLGATH